MIRDYELTVLLAPTLDQKDLDKKINDLQTLLVKNGAKIKAKKDAEKKPLSYEIGKFREAYYLFMELQAESNDAAVWESKIKLLDNVMRLC